jgi:Ca2+-binding RTX toxin-like protein
VLTTNPVDSENILALDFGPTHNSAAGWGDAPTDTARFAGFKALRESGTETHVSGMMAALRDAYESAGVDAPTLLHINAGFGGRSILELMTPQSRVFQDIPTALSSTTAGDIFAMSAGGDSFNFYQRTQDGFTFESTRTGPLVYMDNLRTQLQLAVDYARGQGFALSPTIVFNWIQGQSDNSLKYDQYLNELIDQVNDMVDAVVGSDVKVATLVSQTRGYGGKNISLDQLQVILDRDDVAFGASEFEFQALYPSRVNGDYTHLNPEGYFQMGQRIGRNIFAMLDGKENAPILFDTIEQLDSRTLLVKFSGVDTYLVNDPSRYLAANLMTPPSNMGFFAYGANGSKPSEFAIESAVIVSRNSVRLNFDQDIAGDFTLFLGRTPEDLLTDGPGGLSLASFGGTTLRDAGRLESLQPTSGAALTDPHLYEFAPIQSKIVTANRAPQIAPAHSVQMSENGLNVIDLNANDDNSSEGNGLTYAITGGADAGQFAIDAVTGQLRFLSAPNFEAAADSDRNNIYVLNVGATDRLGATTATTISVTITNVNEAPHNLISSALLVDRNASVGTTIGWLTGADEDIGSILAYDLLAPTNAFFGIDRSTGRVFVSDSARLLATADPVAALTARVSDATGLWLDRSFEIEVRGVAPTIVRYVGTAGADVASYSGPLQWFANGGSGDDRLTGGTGNDSIEGGSGNDRLSGGSGADQLFGGDGNDVLSGGNGNDSLDGGDGDDRLDGNAGADIMRGGAGNDTYDIDDAGDLVFEIQANGQDSGGNDRIIGTASFSMPAFVEQATLTGTADLFVHGNEIANIITGNSGNNLLTGGAGDDRINGGDGNDVLIGGSGRDTLIGGNGQDDFMFMSTGDGSDLISGFATGVDRIVVDASFFVGSKVPLGTIDPSMFTIGPESTNSAHRFIYNPTARVLLFDMDGIGGQDPVTLASFASSTAISYHDILIG